jgi:excisionase family DNA binding protein
MASISPEPQSAFIPQIGRSVSIVQAADLLGVSRRTIYNHIKSGRLATLRTLGGSQRVLVASLEQAATRPMIPWSAASRAGLRG